MTLLTLSLLCIGWTTVETLPQAQELAKAMIAANLAVCVQVEGPITSHYFWEGQCQETQEYRLMVKFLDSRKSIIKEWIEKNHPYSTPEWVVAQTVDALPAYLKWANEPR